MVYRPCVPNENQGVSTTHSQQWDILEERQQEHESLREKMIKDLITFIHSLTACSQDIIIYIDANKPFTPGKSGTDRLVELTDLVDPLINKYGIEGEPPTHQRDSHRIDFIFYTPDIERFISNIGILLIHKISPSDYRALFLDFNHTAFLKDLDHIISSNTCLLSTQSPDSTIIYKNNLNKYIKNMIL